MALHGWGVQWEVPGTVKFSGSIVRIQGCMSAERMGELYLINDVMNSHTIGWCDTTSWNRRCYFLLFPCILGTFLNMTMILRYTFSQGENLQWTSISPDLNTTWVPVGNFVEISWSTPRHSRSFDWALQPFQKVCFHHHVTSLPFINHHPWPQGESVHGKVSIVCTLKNLGRSNWSSGYILPAVLWIIWIQTYIPLFSHTVFHLLNAVVQ